MARHRGFTRQKFIDAVPEDLKQAYLASHGLRGKPPLNETEIDRVLQSVDEIRRKAIDEELHCINDIADRAMDYVQRAYDQFGLELNADWSREQAAMHLFLESSDAFQVAYDLYLWRATANTMSCAQLPAATPVLDGEHLAALASAVTTYLRAQHKGVGCKLRHYEEGDFHLILIARSDYMQTHQIFAHDGNVRTDIFRPAKEDVLLYHPETRVLSMKVAGKSSEDSKMYVEAFGTSVLGLSQAAAAVTRDIVTLSPIRNRRFRYEGNDKIESVKLTALHLRRRGATDITMRLSSGDLRRSLKTDLANIKLSDCEVLAATLRFRLAEGVSTRRPLSVEIRPPHRTTLNKRRDAEIVEAYLRDQGVLLA